MILFTWLFRKRNKVVRQSGFIYKEPEPTDYILGSTSPLTPEVRVPGGNWQAYRPDPERQAKKYTFDTMSCVSFSALNCIEYQIEWMLVHSKLPVETIEYLRNNGYLTEDFRLNLSDRFTAIMSGTTKEGNYYQKVWDSIRHHGLLPEVDLPFTGETFEEYHNAGDITDEMKKKAYTFLSYFDISYELVPEGLRGVALTQAPLQAAIPITAKHAVTMESLHRQFDQYDPFVFDSNKPGREVQYTFKGIITPKKAPGSPVVRTLKRGTTGEDVRMLQDKLIALGFLQGVSDGQFGPITHIAVVAFQKASKLTADGIVGPKTREAIDAAYGKIEKKKQSLAKWKLVPELEEKAIEFLDRCKNAGYSLKITHGFRTVEEQDALYAIGRTKPGKKVTNAKGMKSKHCQGKAFDIAFTGKDPYPTSSKVWEEIGQIGEGCGLVWGGRFSTFKDRPHFEI